MHFNEVFWDFSGALKYSELQGYVVDYEKSLQYFSRFFLVGCG